MKRTVFILLGVLFLTLPIMAQQKDNQGCKDHPLFTRMPDYWIRSCTMKEFDTHVFKIDPGKTAEVQGELWTISYYPQASRASKASELQILTNYENAAAKLGGKVLYRDKTKETLRLTKDGKEVWVEVGAEFTGKYTLIIMEKKAMNQDIVANADALANDLKTMGHSSVYGIYFDTGKSDIKPESGQAIGEIAKLLKSDASLKVHVVGHTDNVGSMDANMKLSRDRAGAVVDALVRDHGIPASRLNPYGDGPYAPVASNDAEEGRAKNRRVELVKQ
jgi:outer membrane protein OmpA-like peptidoglycan-associated protein